MALDFAAFGTPVDQASTLDFSKFGTAVEPPEKESAFRQVADVPLGVAKGAVQGVRMLADVFGAGSETSNTIRSAETYLAGLMSAQAKNDQQEIARIMKEAEDKGVLDQVKAGIKAFTIAPVDTLSSALGTAAPVVAASLGATVLGAPAVVGTGVGALLGAGMGAGVVKGSIYEETKKALIEAGAAEPEAEKKAQLAQSYGGKNLDQILLGTALGGVAAVGPLEKGAAGILARNILGKAGVEEAAETAGEQAVKGALRRRAEAGLLEAVPEAVQAGQEQVAQNVALQREGFDIPTFRGVASASTLEAIAGGGLGATVGGGAPEVAKPEVETIPPVAPEAAAPEVVTIPPEAAADELAQLTPAQKQELERQRVLSERPRTTEEILAEVPFQTGKPTTTLDIDRIRDEHETAVIEGLLAQDVEMTRANEIAAQQRELERQRLEGISEAETTIGGISDVDRRVREGRIFSRVQDLINQDIPFASTAISDINQKFGLINEAPLTDDERARVQNIMGMTQVFTDFVKLPKLAPKPVDQFAENRAMEALIKERGERGQAQPLRTAPAAPSPIIQEAPVSERVGEGEAIRPPSGIQPSVAEDRELVTAAPAIEPAEIASVAPTVETPPAIQAPTIITAQALTDLGVKPGAAILKRLEGKAIDDPEVATQLESYAKRYAPAEIKPAITNFVQTIAAPKAAPVAPPLPEKRVPQSDLTGPVVGGAPVEMPSTTEPPGAGPAITEQDEYERAVVEANKAERRITRLSKSLWGRLRGQLPMQDVRDVSPDKKFRALGNARRGTSLSTLVADGSVDEFLPPDMRHDSPNFDEYDSTEYIKDRLREGTYIDFDAQMATQQIASSVEQLEASIDALQQEKEVNDLIQDAIAEQARVASEAESIEPSREATGTRAVSAEQEVEAGLESYTPEEVTRKQEEQEKAAAAEKKSKTAEQERLRKEQQSKEEKVRADESVKDLELGKTAEEQMTGMGDLFAEPPKREARQGTQKQLEEIDGHAKDIGGTVVYQDGDIALVRGFSLLTGQPVYISVNGGYRAKVDIESYTGNLVTPAQKAELVKVKQELEAEDKAKFDKAPSIKFVDGLATSSNVSAEIAGVVRGWKELLGLKPNLYVTTIDDAVADRNKFTGPQRAIGSAGLDEREAGVVRRLPDGSYYIAFKKNTSKTKMLEVLAHELGHMHEREVFSNADSETKNKIRAEHDKWLASQKGKTARELIQSLRAKTSGKTTRVEKGLPADQLTPYWKSFGEWYADQVSRWAVTSEKPVGVVEQFFSRLAQALRSFYAKIKNAGYLPNETFAQYLNKVAISTDVVSTDDDFSQQMLSEAKGVAEKATAKAQQLLQKQKVPTTGLDHIPEDLRAMTQPIFFPQNKTVLDRIDGMKDKFWQRVAQGVADQYRTIKDYSPVAYMQARISKSIDGALEGLMLHGHVFNDGGALNIRAQTKGMLKVLEPVGKELDSYLMWVALNREFKLPEKKRSKAPNMDKLVANRAQFAAGELNGKPRIDVYEAVAKEMNALNKSVLDVALQNGLINEEGYKNFISNIYYIPFYRRMENGDLEDIQASSGLTSQEFSKELKGGEAPFGDLMENILRNWSHILSASMKNQAATTTLEAAMKQNAAVPNLEPGLEWKDGKVYSIQSGELVPEKKDKDGKVLYKEGELRPDLTKKEAGMAKIVKDGQVMYFKVTEPLLMEAISSIGYLGPKSKFLDVARDFKNILQFGVTLSPTFKVNNLIRDSVAAMGVSELKKNPVANVLQGISLSDPNSSTYISALAGGAIFNFGSAYEGDQAKLIKRLLDKNVSRNTILDSDNLISKGLRITWDKYQEWGNKSEAANRLALYKQMTDKQMSHLEASFMARDLLDFSMQGSWPAFRMVTQVVPFMNARIQGLYKLGRDGIIPTYRVLYNTATGKELNEEEKNRQKEDKLKSQAFLTITAAVGIASAVLYFAFKDDEDFKKRDQWDRDNFWWFKLPGMDAAYRVPKPFEIGAFGTLVERTLEQIYDSGAEGKQFTDSLSRTLWDTFAMNPTPQFIKPLLDIYANKDSFTGAPIESAGLERLSKQERKIDATSAIAVALGGVSTILPEKFEMSPVQMDYIIKAYLGWMGGTAAVISNYATAPFREGEYPDARWLDRLSLGLAKELPSAQSKYVTAFYDSNKEISQAFADMRHYAEAGDSEKVQRILEERGDKIALAKFYDKTAKSMASVRQQINIVTKDATMGGAEKKMEIDRLKQIISTLAQQAEEVRKSMKQ